MMKVDSKKPQFDLEERLAKYAELNIDLVKKVKITAINERIIKQLVASSGSSGANYCEANEAESGRDFSHKIGIVKKELKESLHWLRLFARVHPQLKEEIRVIWQEGKELLLIFAAIRRKSHKK